MQETVNGFRTAAIQRMRRRDFLLVRVWHLDKVDFSPGTVHLRGTLNRSDRFAISLRGMIAWGEDCMGDFAAREHLGDRPVSFIRGLRHQTSLKVR